MVFQLAIVILIPIILGIVIVSPFEKEPMGEHEAAPERQVSFNILFLVLGLIWLFFLVRLLRQIFLGTFKIKTRF